MNQKFLNIFLALIIISLACFLFFKKNSNTTNIVQTASNTEASPFSEEAESKISLSTSKTFTFDNFHGSKVSEKFSFEYPSNWYNEGQYFSSEKIEYYDLYSVKAPFYFDLIRSDVFNQTEIKYQIDQSKRKAPDMVGKINGKDFKKYDLIDYGSYEGDYAGRVIIYVGPNINIDGKDYTLVFHWEEKPLTVEVKDNSSEIFEKVVKSLKFFR